MPLAMKQETLQQQAGKTARKSAILLSVSIYGPRNIVKTEYRLWQGDCGKKQIISENQTQAAFYYGNQKTRVNNHWYLYGGGGGGGG
jgi:hypothetical protein